MKINKEIVLYLLFGALTTLVNIISFALLTMLNVGTALSTIISWFFSVLFAFFTNKFWVFKSKSKSFLNELFSFFVCRLSTGVIDLGIMLLFVDVLLCNSLFMKIISNIIVIILNYVLSKFYIFRTKKSQ